MMDGILPYLYLVLLLMVVAVAINYALHAGSEERPRERPPKDKRR